MSENPMLRQFDSDTLITYIAQFTGALVGVIVIKLFASHLSAEQFGALLSSRRVVGMAVPLITLNLSLSLARYNGINPQMRNRFILVSIGSSFAIWGALSLILVVFDSQLANLLFGDVTYLPFFHSLLIFFFASAIHNLFTGYWRGLQRFKVMNLLTSLFHVSNVLMLLFLFVSNLENLAILNRYYLYLTILTILINAGLYFYFESKVDGKTLMEPIHIRAKTELLKEFFYYGYMRLPSGLFYALLFMLPVIAATNSISLVSAANVGIVVSVANLVFLFGFPLNLLLLPKFATHQKQDSAVELEGKIQSQVDFTFGLPLLISPALLLFSDEIIIILFDPKYLHIVLYLKLFSLVAGFFLAYISLRGLLDGLKTHPYANYVTGLGVIVTMILTGLFALLGMGEIGIVMGFCLGLFSLYISNLLIIRSQYQIQIFTPKNVSNLVVSLAGIILIFFLNPSSTHPQLVVTHLAVKLISFGVYALFAIKMYMFSKQRFAH